MSFILFDSLVLNGVMRFTTLHDFLECEVQKHNVECTEIKLIKIAMSLKY